MERINADIKKQKRELRAKYRKFREELNPRDKKDLDESITNRLLSDKNYQNAETVLVYVSAQAEIDTINIINAALRQNKKVAVPKCTDDVGHMEFYYINSLDDLENGCFGILQPKSACKRYDSDGKDSICIIPAFSFDKKGYRLGYGKGYYDRFLHNFSGIKTGLCYSVNMESELPRGRFDERADFIITENSVLTINKNGG